MKNKQQCPNFVRGMRLKYNKTYLNSNKIIVIKYFNSNKKYSNKKIVITYFNKKF